MLQQYPFKVLQLDVIAKLKSTAAQCERLSLIDEIITSFTQDTSLAKLDDILKRSLPNKKTLLVTDKRMLLHADFDNYQNCQKRVAQKEDQPENSERLMVLIDSEKGVLTQSDALIQNPRYQVKDSVSHVKISDVLRVHDYNYLMKVINISDALENTDNEIRVRFDRDCHISKFTWESSLLSCGSVIEAVDSIMKGEANNAFCAVRPPGHHAGVFGKTL